MKCLFLFDVTTALTLMYIFFENVNHRDEILECSSLGGTAVMSSQRALAELVT